MNDSWHVDNVMEASAMQSVENCFRMDGTADNEIFDVLGSHGSQNVFIVSNFRLDFSDTPLKVFYQFQSFEDFC